VLGGDGRFTLVGSIRNTATFEHLEFRFSRLSLF
jgi:hypothetical protein